jgi:hypothetical protein
MHFIGEYIEAMRNVSRTEDWNEWIRFFLEAVKELRQYH